MTNDNRSPSSAPRFFYPVVILGAVLIIIAIVVILSTAARTREEATGTQAQVYDALEACSINYNPVTGPSIIRNEQTGAVRVSGARGSDIEDCLRRAIPKPQDPIILGGQWWRADTHIPGEEERAAEAREKERVHAAHEDRAQFLREHIVGYVTSRLDLKADATTVDVTQSPKGQWKHEMVIDLGDTDVKQRVRAVELIAVLRESEALDPEDAVVVRATGWPDVTP